MDQVMDTLNQLWHQGVPVVLATIVRVEGSAYRREGARMLFAEDGTIYGTLSAGCLETDLAYRVEAVQKSRTPAVHVYDMSSEDDFTWGRGSGCNGIITVLLEPIRNTKDALSDEYWGLIREAYTAGRVVATVRRLDRDSGETLGFLVTTPDGVIQGTLGDAVTDPLWAERLRIFTAADSKGGQSFVDGESLYVMERVWTKDKLFLFGAGPDAVPMVEMLAPLGFDVTVVDHRPARLDPALFPRASRLLDCRPERASECLDIPKGAYALVMTHSFQTDKEWLEFLLEQPLRYLGVLGPKLRTQRLLGREELPGIVKSPIGLNIGADGPEEIAVSVAAELIQVRRNVSSPAEVS